MNLEFKQFFERSTQCLSAKHVIRSTGMANSGELSFLAAPVKYAGFLAIVWISIHGIFRIPKKRKRYQRSHLCRSPHKV